jgi:hypothetical protein
VLCAKRRAFPKGTLKSARACFAATSVGVENGHTVPAIETMEKMARALEVPLYQLFYDGEEPPALPNLPKRRTADDIAWGSSGKDARLFNQLRRQLSRMDEGDRRLLLFMAQKMSRHVAGRQGGKL